MSASKSTNAGLYVDVGEIYIHNIVMVHHCGVFISSIYLKPKCDCNLYAVMSNPLFVGLQQILESVNF